MKVIEPTVTTKSAYRVVVALREGFYGASSGSGFSNRDLLVALTRLLPPGRLVVVPVRQDSEPVDPLWTDRLMKSLQSANARLLPIKYSSGHGHDLVVEAVADAVSGADRCLLIGLGTSLLGLADHAMDNVDLLLVPRSTAALSCPDDLSAISWERDRLHAAVMGGGHVAAISTFMRHHLRQDYGLPGGALVDMPNGLLLDADSTDEPLPLPGPAKAGFLLALGRPVPDKGFEDLLAALKILRRRVPVPHLVLAATSPGAPTGYQRRLAQLIEDSGVDATLTTRFSPRIRSWMSSPALRGIVVPSRSEPFGRIPLEAFAAGAGPVVATRVGGLRETVVDGFTGFTAEPDDLVSLAEAIHRALSVTPAERTRLMETGTAVLHRRHDYLTTIRRALSAVAPWTARSRVR